MQRVLRAVRDVHPGILLGVMMVLVAINLVTAIKAALEEPAPAWAAARTVSQVFAELPWQLAPLLLAVLLATTWSRRRRGIAAITIVATLVIGGIVLPVAWSRTNVANEGVIGMSFMPAPEGWSWPQRIGALRSGQTPDGEALNAVTVAQMKQQVLEALLLPLVLGLLLSAAMRQGARRLNAWVALVTSFSTFLLWVVPFRRFMAAGLPPTAMTCLAIIPMLAVAAAAHAWCTPAGVAERRTRLAWTTTALVAFMGYLAAMIAPQALIPPGIAQVGDPAPRIDVTTFTGEPLQFEGDNDSVVVLTYWASWCGPCRAEQAFLDDVVREHGSALTVVAVNNGETLDVAREAWSEMGSPREAYMPRAALLRSFPVASLPSSYVIDRQGRVRAIHLGYYREILEPELTALLAEPK